MIALAALVAGDLGAQGLGVLDPGLDDRGVDAVVGANDFSTLGALDVLQEREINVPHQVAVVGFDDAEEARGATPSLTTVRQPYFDLAAGAVDTLLAMLDGQRVPERVVTDVAPGPTAPGDPDESKG